MENVVSSLNFHLKIDVRKIIIAHNKSCAFTGGFKSGIKRRSAYVIPVSVLQCSDDCIVQVLTQLKRLHINWTFLLQNFRCFGGLVVEGHISSDFLHELDLLRRASRPNHLEAVSLRKLDDKATKAAMLYKEIDPK